jgi:outer membrane protein assembly factor BamA
MGLASAKRKQSFSLGSVRSDARALRLAAAATLCLVALRFSPHSALAQESTRPERDISDSMAESHKQAENGEGEQAGTRWTLLPQIGYDPETSINAGVKLRNNDLLSSGYFIDLNGVVSLRKREEASLSLGNPHLWHDRLLAFFNLYGLYDDSREFFGIGNNDVGPDPISNHNIRRINAAWTIGSKFLDNSLALNLGFTLRWTKVSRGQSHDTPSTQDLFPDLPGIHGGWSNEFAISAVYTNRESVERPTRGWVLTGKGSWVPSVLGNDFQYWRVTGDASYLFPLLTRRQLLGTRLSAESLFGPSDRVPFYELSSLGGADNLRGYFPQRFLGKGKVFGNAEYRLKLFDFWFYNLWQVMIDGVAFIDAGRVFVDYDDLKDNILDHYKWDYGGGLRIAFSSGEVARIDVAISHENKPNLFLTFGHTF